MSGLEGAEVPRQPGMDFSEAGFLQELQVRSHHLTLHLLGSHAFVPRILLPRGRLTTQRGAGPTGTLRLLLVIYAALEAPAVRQVPARHL